MDNILKPLPTRLLWELKCAAASLEIAVLMAMRSCLLWTVVVLSSAVPGAKEGISMP